MLRLDSTLWSTDDGHRERERDRHVPRVLLPFVVDGPSGRSRVLTVVNNAAVNTGVQGSFEIPNPFLQGARPGVGLQDHMAARFCLF